MKDIFIYVEIQLLKAFSSIQREEQIIWDDNRYNLEWMNDVN